MLTELTALNYCERILTGIASYSKSHNTVVAILTDGGEQFSKQPPLSHSDPPLSHSEGCQLTKK